MGLNDEALNAKRDADHKAEQEKLNQQAALQREAENVKNRFLHEIKTNCIAARGVKDFKVGKFEYREVIQQVWESTLNYSGIYGTIEWTNDGHKFFGISSGNIGTGVSIEIAPDPKDKKASTRFRADTLEQIGEALLEEQRRLGSN